MPSLDFQPAVTALRRHYGFQRFRPAQKRVVRAVLAGGDVLAVLPTGSGKSICFQVPALLDPGLTLVVSPLISLMQDQVAAAVRRQISAAALTSASSLPDRSSTARALKAGHLRLLYVSPERLHSRGFRALLSGVRVARLAVDEAHCISEWGHDFRPSYRRIGEFARAVGRPPLAAFTATATPATRSDVEACLGLRRPLRVVASVDRPNLHWSAVRVRGLREAIDRAGAEVLTSLRSRPGSGAILYAPTRRTAAQAAEALCRLGIRASYYHAGMDPDGRRHVQDRFLAGDLAVVCATSAFGMGIDHPRIRLVCHCGMPGALESYVQEAGRAGRDGERASCLLIAGREDEAVQRSLIGQSWPSPEAWCGSSRLSLGPVTLVRVWRARSRHERSRAAERPPAPRGIWLRADGCRAATARGARSSEARRELGGSSTFQASRRGARRALWRLSEMQGYVRSASCRRASIATYFGERAPLCTGCDRCG